MAAERKAEMATATDVTLTEVVMVVGNKTHEAAFLEPIPLVLRDAALTSVRGQGFMRLLDRETRRDLWVVCDGKRAWGLTLCGLSLNQHAKVRAHFDEHYLDFNGEPTAFGPDVLAGIVEELRAGQEWAS